MARQPLQSSPGHVSDYSNYEREYLLFGLFGLSAPVNELIDNVNTRLVYIFDTKSVQLKTLTLSSYFRLKGYLEYCLLRWILYNKFKDFLIKIEELSQVFLLNTSYCVSDQVTNRKLIDFEVTWRSIKGALGSFGVIGAIFSSWSDSLNNS